MIPSREGANLVVHVGKNVDSPSLFFTSYLNAARLGPNVPLFSYQPPRHVVVEIFISEDYVFRMKVDAKEVARLHINPTLTQRLNMIAWGDEHDFAVDFTNIQLRVPANGP